MEHAILHDRVAEELLSVLPYLAATDKKLVSRALERAREWHAGQLRESGDPYVSHPIAVAAYLGRLEAGREMLVAALLHDIIEDGRASAEAIVLEFGEDVAKLVDGVTKLTKLRYQGKRAERQVASLRKMLLTASEDLRIILIKLADRWHNIETLDALPEDKQQRIASETLDIYVPFARLMGLWDLKQRLEERCFPVAFPQESAAWHLALLSVRETLQAERTAFVERIDAKTGKDVHARLMLMTDYELYQKLQGNPDRLSETQSVDSVLLVIETSHASPVHCYTLLGEIHSQYPASFVGFRDYINAPLPNGYRGLHTTIFLSRNHQLRLRIQTGEMYEHSSKRKISSWITQKDSDIYSVLASLHKKEFDQEKYLTALKNTVLTERMNVFTTAGEIITLPRGAAGIDFAFTVNPDHLSYLAGVRINGELQPPTHELKDGDTVELVLLNERVELQAFWIEKAKSIGAQETMKQSLEGLPDEEQETGGRSLLAYECRKRRLPVWPLFHLSSIQQHLTKEFQTDTFPVLLRRIGSGHIAVGMVAEAYKEILVLSPTWGQKLLKFLHLLPRSRVLNRKASVFDLEVYAQDRSGLISDISKCIAERKINIAKFAVYAVPPKDALYKIRVEVENFAHFSEMFDALLQVPSVKTVLRRK